MNSFSTNPKIEDAIIGALRLEDQRALLVASVPCGAAADQPRHVFFRIRHCRDVAEFRVLVKMLAAYGPSGLDPASRRLVGQYAEYSGYFGSIDEAIEGNHSIGLSAFGKICVRFRLYELGEAVHRAALAGQPIYHFITRPRRHERWRAGRELHDLMTRCSITPGNHEKNREPSISGKPGEPPAPGKDVSGVQLTIGRRRGDVIVISATVDDAETVEWLNFEVQSDDRVLKSAREAPSSWSTDRQVIFDLLLDHAYFNVNSRHATFAVDHLKSPNGAEKECQVGLRLTPPFSIDLNHEIGVGPFVLIGSWGMAARVGVPGWGEDGREEGDRPGVDVRDGVARVGFSAIPEILGGEFGLAVNSTYRTGDARILNAGWYIPLEVGPEGNGTVLQANFDQTNSAWRPLGGGFVGTLMDNAGRYGAMSLNETLRQCKSMALIFRHKNADALYGFPECVLQGVAVTMENKSLLAGKFARLESWDGMSEEAARDLTDGRVGGLGTAFSTIADGAFGLRWKFTDQVTLHSFSIHQDAFQSAKTVSIWVTENGADPECAWRGQLPMVDLEQEGKTAAHVRFARELQADILELRVEDGYRSGAIGLNQFEVFGTTSIVSRRAGPLSRSLTVAHRSRGGPSAARLAIVRDGTITHTDWQAIEWF